MRNPTIRTWCGLAVLTAAAVPPAARGVPYTGLVVFGDSLSDDGNDSLITGGSLPGPAYYQGRFSDGPNYVDDLAPKLSLAVPTPSVAGGTDYAYGGATTVQSQPQGIQGVNQQVATYLAGNRPPATTLFDVYVGANDVISGLFAPTPADGTAIVTAAAAAVVSDVDSLYQHGAREFLVPNLPLIGQVPEFLGNASTVTVGDADTITFNDDEAAGLAGLGTTDPAIDIHTVDVQTLFASVQADPAAYGFTNATTPAAPGLVAGNDSYDTSQEVSDPQDYLFWDGIHPTAAGHALLADAAAAALVPEPASLSAVAVGLLLVGRRRRR